MDYDGYTADSSRLVKTGHAYRLLGHDYATYCQYAIYVSPSPRRSLPPILSVRSQFRTSASFLLFGLCSSFCGRGKQVVAFLLRHRDLGLTVRV